MKNLGLAILVTCFLGTLSFGATALAGEQQENRFILFNGHVAPLEQPVTFMFEKQTGRAWMLFSDGKTGPTWREISLSQKQLEKPLSSKNSKQ